MKHLSQYKPKSLADWALEDFFKDDFFDFSRKQLYPAVDVKEQKNEYILEADVPGYSENQIDITVKNDRLTLSSSKEENQGERKEHYYLKERTRRAFCRTFTLPKDVAREKISAVFKRGVLTLTMEKRPEASPRKIEIK